MEEGRDSCAQEFQRMLADARLSRTLDDALAEMAARMGSENFSSAIDAEGDERKTLSHLFRRR